MFSTDISATSPFVDKMASTAFSNISGLPFFGDYSFVATLRALLHDKNVGDLEIHHNYEGGSASRIEYFYDRPNEIFVKMRTSKGPVDIDTLPEEWEEVNKIHDFYIKAMEVRCFIERDLKSVIIFCNNASKWAWHFLQCSIPAFLPWFFEDGISGKKLNLVRSLMNRDAGNYIKALEELAADTNIREEYIKKMVSGFSKGIDESRIGRLEGSIRDIDYQISETETRITQLLKNRQENCLLLLGLKNRKNVTDEDEFVDYLLSNKRIDPTYASDGTFRFIVKDYIQFYDVDLMLDCLANPYSYFFKYSGMSDDDIRILMKAIFETNDIKLRTCAAFEIRSDGYVCAQSRYDYGDTVKMYMPNPHLDEYSCMGDNASLIRNMILKENDYIGAVEQCLASARNLNFADSTVMEHFMSYIVSTTNKVLELPDGVLVDPKQAVRWIKEEADK